MNLPSSTMKYSATDNTVSRPFLRQKIFCSLSARPRQCEAEHFCIPFPQVAGEVS